MKLECIKETLRDAVQHAERMTGKNATLPVLASLVLETHGQTIHVKATNLDLGVELVVPAKVEVEGSVAVAGGTLSQFLSALGGDRSVKLESVEGNLKIQGEHHEALIKSLPVADFPSLPRVEDGVSVKLPARALVSAFRSVSYAASLSDMKPEIASIYLYGDGQYLVSVATDSFRLAEKRVDVGRDIPEGFSLLIPHRNASEIVKLFENEPEDIEIAFNKNQISCASMGVYFTSRLVSGVFPNYRQIIPTAKKTGISLEKREFVSALKLAQIFSDKFNQVQIRLAPSKNLFEITSKSFERGENITRVESVMEGDDLEMSFNVRYIVDGFQSIPEDRITLSLNGPGRPMVMRGDGNSTFTYLVMPMNR